MEEKGWGSKYYCLKVNNKMYLQLFSLEALSVSRPLLKNKKIVTTCSKVNNTIVKTKSRFLTTVSILSSYPSIKIFPRQIASLRRFCLILPPVRCCLQYFFLFTKCHAAIYIVSSVFFYFHFDCPPPSRVYKI